MSSSDNGSVDSGETLRFEEEIQSLMLDAATPPPPNGGFTALLGLPASRAVELLRDPSGATWRPEVPPGCSPTFPSDVALVERAARLSVFAAAESLPPVAAKTEPKIEPADSGGSPAKRKEAERCKVRAKKSRGSAEERTGGDQLPYVHVRARRGQATDSHSLAERARREKINARMKLLQELVPGCSKITGTALVLDEIINHVQSLQRQVEFLSMRLAAVNPRIDFIGLDSFLSAAECVRVTAEVGMGVEQPLVWSEVNGGRRHQLMWHHQQQDHQASMNPSSTASLFGSYDSAASVSLSNQLKTHL